MPHISKRQKIISQKIVPGQIYSVDQAIELLKSLPQPKFKSTKPTIEFCAALGIDPRNSEHAVRRATQMPHGLGKTIRVGVIAQGVQADAAQAAGADIVGFEDLADKIKAGQIDFDVLIATPDAMRLVGQLGQILGPKGLMPNPKVGTVTADVGAAVKNAKAGQVQYRSEKGGLIHCGIGKLDFDTQAIKENLKALLSDLRKARPATAKGIFIKKVWISSTMSPALVIDQASLD